MRVTHTTFGKLPMDAKFTWNHIPAKDLPGCVIEVKRPDRLYAPSDPVTHVEDDASPIPPANVPQDDIPTGIAIGQQPSAPCPNDKLTDPDVLRIKQELLKEIRDLAEIKRERNDGRTGAQISVWAAFVEIEQKYKEG